MPIQVGIVAKSVESAQRKVEGNHFASRKHVLAFDDVMNRQREIIYTQRDQVLKGEDMKPVITKMIDDSIGDDVEFSCPSGMPKDEWHLASLREKYLGWLTTENDFKDDSKLRSEDVYNMLTTRAHELHDKREELYGIETMREIERAILLKNVDLKWMDYIDAMDELKQSVGLLAYGQKDPVVAFRQMSYDMFDEMTSAIREDTVKIILSAHFKSEEEVKREQVAKVTSASAGNGDGTEKGRTVRNEKKKVGVNDPCPCGSGKKYKKCCGRPGADKA